MQMHQTVGLSGKPFADLGTPGRQPEIVHMKHANFVAPGLLHAEIGLCRPGQQIGTVFGSDQQLAGKAVDDLQARVSRASVDDNHLNSAVLLIYNRLERGGEPSLAIKARNDHREPGSLHRPSVAHRCMISHQWRSGFKVVSRLEAGGFGDYHTSVAATVSERRLTNK